jgi:hypothetical protein
VSIRKQYFFLPSDRGLLAWDVDRLIDLTKGLVPRRVPLAQIRELDEPWHGDDETVTWRGFAEHMRLVDEADLAFPIILSASGRVMDGMHRVVKAVLQGWRDIAAVQFETDPPPDHVGRDPAELPYDRA